jgi:hypothetical protein
MLAGRAPVPVGPPSSAAASCPSSSAPSLRLPSAAASSSSSSAPPLRSSGRCPSAAPSDSSSPPSPVNTAHAAPAAASAASKAAALFFASRALSSFCSFCVPFLDTWKHMNHSWKFSGQSGWTLPTLSTPTPPPGELSTPRRRA